MVLRSWCVPLTGLPFVNDRAPRIIISIEILLSKTRLLISSRSSILSCRHGSCKVNLHRLICSSERINTDLTFDDTGIFFFPQAGGVWQGPKEIVTGVAVAVDWFMLWYERTEIGADEIRGLIMSRHYRSWGACIAFSSLFSPCYVQCHESDQFNEGHGGLFRRKR